MKRYDLINLCSSMIVHAHAKTRARALLRLNNTYCIYILHFANKT